jgi:nicotinamide riboside kinase
MRINIYGGPGSGKSTTAAYLFAKLKSQGQNVELVTEYIKTWAWEQRVPTGYDQAYIFAKQLRSEDLLTRRGIHVITDSPLPMQLVYAKRYACPFYDELYSLCKKFDQDHPSLHILLRRTVPYQTFGRYETLEQAKELDISIQTLLAGYGSYMIFDPTAEKKRILSTVCNALEE